MKLFIQKLLWFFLAIGGYFAICFMLELPMTSIVYALTDNEDPNLVTKVTSLLGALLMIYVIYLKRVRNDAKRRQYLTNVRRRYGSFATDAHYIAKSSEFQSELLVFALFTVGLLVYLLLQVVKEGGTTLSLLLAMGVWLLVSGVLAILYAVGNLLIYNWVHRVWIADLEVPEESDEAVELRKKHRALRRNLIIQLILSLSFFVLYLYDPYMVTFSVVVTPAIFLMTHVQSIMGIVHMRNIDQPYQKYALFHCLLLGIYILSLLFGVFAPK